MPNEPNLDALLPVPTGVFHILIALADRDRHGYAIMQDVLEQTNGSLTLGPGTLYGCLKRMTEAGLVVENSNAHEAADVDDRRRYYQMTALGRRVASAEADRLANAVAAARTRGVLSQAGAAQ